MFFKILRDYTRNYFYSVNIVFYKEYLSKKSFNYSNKKKTKEHSSKFIFIYRRTHKLALLLPYSLINAVSYFFCDGRPMPYRIQSINLDI